MEFFRKLYKLLQPFHAKIIRIGWLTLAFEVVKLANPYIFKEVIDAILGFDESAISYLVWLVVVMLVVDVSGSWFYRYIDFRRFDFLLGVIRYLPEMAHQKLLALSLGYHQRENTGNKITRITRGVDKIDQLLSSVMWDFLPTLFQFCVTFVFIMLLDWPLGLVFMVMIPPYLWLTLRMNRTVRPWRQTVQTIDEESSGNIGQSIINIRTVQSFVQEQREVDDNIQLLNRLTQLRWSIWKTILNYNFSRNTLLDIGRVSLLGYGVWQTANGYITPGSLVLFLTLSEKVYISLYRLSRIYDRILDSAESVDRLSQLLDEEPDIATVSHPNRAALIGGVTFDRVSFTYPQGTEALREVSFTINPGQTVALVGPSGSGKTTVVNLLYRHYDAQSGRVLLDGVDVRERDPFEFRRQLAIVTQDIDIFNDTVERNIAYATPTASPEAIRAAAQVANADEFIDRLPEGYQTIVGERGVKLSGGQKQRIGIARAVLAEPKILIFDEATSQLDSMSERLIQQALLRLRERCTVFFIAHRLSTVRSADRIFVFDGGRLVEEGRHSELRQASGLYARLHQLQVSGELV